MQRRARSAAGEAALYGLAAVVYVALGVRYKGLVLNWVVGPIFPFLAVYALPRWVRSRWERSWWARRSPDVADAADVVDLREQSTERVTT